MNDFVVVVGSVVLSIESAYNLQIKEGGKQR